jgi:predicted RNA-binding protein with PIN domain
LDRVGRADQADELRVRIADQERELMRLRSRVDTVTAERDQARRDLSDAAPAAERELDKLRTRLREQGVRVKSLEQQLTATKQEAAQALTALETELAGARRSVAEAQLRAVQAADRADRAGRALTAARDEAGRDRAAADQRLDLLLSTVQDAAAGLRRELLLTTGGARPGDVVADTLPGAAPGRGRAADASMLGGWLQLPAAHLIVDGYNVTKTGYPELTLVDQRDRLIRGLASLASRTSAEITVVFDGAAVTTAQPPGRGIRVLFSPPGVIADDVIRTLVAEEPPGRVVVVASSDREVVSGVRRDGARTVASAVLLDLLSAGRANPGPRR